MSHFAALLIILISISPLVYKHKKHIKNILSNALAIAGGAAAFISVWLWLFPAYDYFRVSDVIAALLKPTGIAFLLLTGNFWILEWKRQKVKRRTSGFLAFSIYIMPVLAFCSIKSDAVANVLVEKATSNNLSIDQGGEARQLFIQRLAHLTKESGRKATPSERRQLAQVIEFTAGLLPTSIEESTDSEKVRKLLTWTKKVDESITLLVTSTTDSKIIAQSEQSSSQISRKLKRLGEQHVAVYSANDFSNEGQLTQILQDTIDSNIKQYMVRTNHYFETDCKSGSEEAFRYYPTMRGLSALVQGKEMELDLALFAQCNTAVKNRKQMSQMGLYLKGMGDAIPASDFTLDNEQRILKAIEFLVTLRPPSAHITEHRQTHVTVLRILAQWKSWAKMNNLHRIVKAINHAGDSNHFTKEELAAINEQSASMRMDVYVGEIDKIVQDLNFHRGSFERVKPRNDEEMRKILDGHQVTRRIQADSWRQLVNVPRDPEVEKLQTSLKIYFKEADRVFEYRKIKHTQSSVQAQQKADTALFHCLASLAGHVSEVMLY
jgi:hypothetical protein